MKKSEWEYIGGDGIEVWRCKKCSCFVLDDDYERCPRCGRKMKGVKAKYGKKA